MKCGFLAPELFLGSKTWIPTGSMWKWHSYQKKKHSERCHMRLDMSEVRHLLTTVPMALIHEFLRSLLGEITFVFPKLHLPLPVSTTRRYLQSLPSLRLWLTADMTNQVHLVVGFLAFSPLLLRARFAFAYSIWKCSKKGSTDHRNIHLDLDFCRGNLWGWGKNKHIHFKWPNLFKKNQTVGKTLNGSISLKIQQERNQQVVANDFSWG